MILRVELKWGEIAITIIVNYLGVSSRTSVSLKVLLASALPRIAWTPPSLAWQSLIEKPLVKGLSWALCEC